MLIKKDWLLVLVGFLAALGLISWYVSRVNESHPATWPMYGGDIGRRFHSPVALPTKGDILWTYPLTEREFAPPVAAADGTIYVAGARELTAVGPDGKRRWTWKNQDMIISLALGRHGEVYLQDVEGVSAFSPEGLLQWRLPLESTRSGGAMMVGQGGTVYAMALPYLHAISDDGKLRWRLRSPQWTSAPVEQRDGMLLAVSDEVLYAVSRKGDVKWQRELPGAMWVTLGQNGDIYVRGRDRIWVLDSRGNRQTEWRTALNAEPVSLLAMGKDYIQEGNVRRSLTGETLWTAQLPESSGWAHVLVDGKGNTLVQQYGLPFRTVRGGALSFGGPQAVLLLDPAGEILWHIKEIRPLQLPVPAGEGRLCMIGFRNAAEGPALICIGEK